MKLTIPTLLSLIATLAFAGNLANASGTDHHEMFEKMSLAELLVYMDTIDHKIHDAIDHDNFDAIHGLDEEIYAAAHHLTEKSKSLDGDHFHHLEDDIKKIDDIAHGLDVASQNHDHDAIVKLANELDAIIEDIKHQYPASVIQEVAALEAHH